MTPLITDGALHPEFYTPLMLLLEMMWLISGFCLMWIGFWRLATIRQDLAVLFMLFGWCAAVAAGVPLLDTVICLVVN